MSKATKIKAGVKHINCNNTTMHITIDIDNWRRNTLFDAYQVSLDRAGGITFEEYYDRRRN